jgi:hypothetical protein
MNKLLVNALYKKKPSGCQTSLGNRDSIMPVSKSLPGLTIALPKLCQTRKPIPPPSTAIAKASFRG